MDIKELMKEAKLVASVANTESDKVAGFVLNVKEYVRSNKDRYGELNYDENKLIQANVEFYSSKDDIVTAVIRNDYLSFGQMGSVIYTIMLDSEDENDFIKVEVRNEMFTVDKNMIDRLRNEFCRDIIEKNLDIIRGSNDASIVEGNIIAIFDENKIAYDINLVDYECVGVKTTIYKLQQLSEDEVTQYHGLVGELLVEADNIEEAVCIEYSLDYRCDERNKEVIIQISLEDDRVEAVFVL